MPLRYKSRILAHLAHGSYTPSPRRQLARKLRVDPDDRAVFDRAVDELGAAGKLVVDKEGRVALPAMADEIVGRFRLNARGFGFVIPDDPHREGDLYIPRGNARDAISGDRVRARVSRRSGGRGRRDGGGSGRRDVSGTILEVVERGRDQFVGSLVQKGRQWLVEPDGRSLHDPVIVRDPHAKNAKAGDKVVIELLHYPEGEYYAEGVITKVLGEAGRPDVETQAVIEAHGLRTDFADAVVRGAQEAARSFDPETALDEASRENLTERFVFTIDPPDARDFDDAITIEHDAEAKEWTLGVHIADVSHFVRPRTPLDEEARTRGNSVYLPRLVLPMLPEVLSNGVCSLQEGVPRFAKSAFITFDARGTVLSQRLAATVIRSAKRLTYLEAQALIDGDRKEATKNARTDPVYTDELIEALGRANQLARLLRKRRLRDGMIVLSLPEVELIFDDDGHVIDAVPEDDAFTHTIIEMFMVEANEAVARAFDDLGVPILRRIHPEPKFASLEEMTLYARALRHEVPDHPTRHDLQRLLDATRDSPAARAIHFSVLRTLAKATYSPAQVGHFALASDHYAHFTSPIRRYPDLTLHRAIAAYLERTENGQRVPGGRKRQALGKQLLDDARVPDEAELITLGRHLSDTEDAAEAAERELREFLVMQLLKEQHLGEEFDGVVTGVMGSGVFVSIERYLVEGLVRSEDLPSSGDRPDTWRPDGISGRLVAQRSGAVLGIGDVVRVQIANVDLATRHLDLRITEMPARTMHEGVAKSSARGRGQAPRSQKKKPGAKRGRGRRR